MIREDVLRMAREAGIEWSDVERLDVPSGWPQFPEKFVRVIVAAYDLGVTREREACAKVCDLESLDACITADDRAYNLAIKHCAAAIRARV